MGGESSFWSSWEIWLPGQSALHKRIASSHDFVWLLFQAVIIAAFVCDFSAFLWHYHCVATNVKGWELSGDLQTFRETWFLYVHEVFSVLLRRKWKVPLRNFCGLSVVSQHVSRSGSALACHLLLSVGGAKRGALSRDTGAPHDEGGPPPSGRVQPLQDRPHPAAPGLCTQPSEKYILTRLVCSLVTCFYVVLTDYNFLRQAFLPYFLLLLFFFFLAWKAR